MKQNLKKQLIGRLQQLNIMYRAASTVYFDFRKAEGYSDVLTALSDALWDEMDKRRTTCVAAAGYGGIPLAAVLSSRHNPHLTLVNEEYKTHGKRTWKIDGYTPTSGDGVAIVDDVFTTGQNLRNIIRVIEPTHATILGCYVILKRGEGELDVPLSYLFTPKDLR